MRNLRGVVIQEVSVKEQDKFIKILTAEEGVIEVFVRGARKLTGKNASCSQLFACADFCIEERRGRYTLNSAEPVHIFYQIREDLEQLSLASYFAELIGFSVPQGADENDVQRLFLNSLYYLEKGLRPPLQIKSIFELRLLSEIGFMPSFDDCGCQEKEILYFDVWDGVFLCNHCRGERGEERGIPLNASVKEAMEGIVSHSFERLFQFSMSENGLELLNRVTEAFVLAQMERSFRALKFYQDIRKMQNIKIERPQKPQSPKTNSEDA